jgi:hypothetical protein
MHLKKIFQDKYFRQYTGGPLCSKKILFSIITFFRCILSPRWVYIFEIYVKFCIFWYPWSPYCEKIFFDSYVVHGPKGRDQLWRGHWIKKKFHAISGTFGRHVTNLRGTFVENVKKKSKINPPYCTVYSTAQR